MRFRFMNYKEISHKSYDIKPPLTCCLSRGCNKVGSLSLAECLVGFDPGYFLIPITAP